MTSLDINNTAIPLSLMNFIQEQFVKALLDLVETLKTRAREWKDIPMLARTHGQPATPTLVGKEVSIPHFVVYTFISMTGCIYGCLLKDWKDRLALSKISPFQLNLEEPLVT